MSDLIERLTRNGATAEEIVAAALLEAKDKRIAELDKMLDKIHKLTASKYGNPYCGDGWLKVMQIADPSRRSQGE